MDPHWNILVVSAHLDNRRAILRILEGLPVDAFAASTIQQALEVLGQQPIRLVFSEESFVDGTYLQLLGALRDTETKTPLVLMLTTCEWDEYLGAIAMGVFEVLRCPLQPTDVELALIRAARVPGAPRHPAEKPAVQPRAGSTAIGSAVG